MPANSGAITGTKAHKHSALSADGGFLDDGVTGVTGTANGSLLMFDGSSVAQDLPAGNVNEVLTMGAALPSWAAIPPASGGQLSHVTSVELAVSNNTISCPIAPAINQSDICYLMAVLNSDVNGVGVGQHTYLTVNSLAANYDWQGAFYQGGAQFLQNQINQTAWRAHHVNHGYERGAMVYLWCNTHSENINGILTSGSADTLQVNSLFNDSGAQTSFSDITFQLSGGLMEVGSRVDIYKVLL